jgi:hypothetical protein
MNRVCIVILGLEIQSALSRDIIIYASYSRPFWLSLEDTSIFPTACLGHPLRVVKNFSSFYGTRIFISIHARVPILSRINPVHTLHTHFFKNMFISFTPRSFKLPFFFKFSYPPRRLLSSFRCVSMMHSRDPP